VSSLTQKIDLRSPATFDHGHPAEQYRWLRDNAPVYWHEEPGARGFWAVTRYDLVRQASVDFETYSNSFGMTLGTSPTRSCRCPASSCPGPPPGRTSSPPRRPTSSTRSASAASATLVTDVAGKLPSYVISQLLGIPREDGVRLYGWTETTHASPDAVTDEERNAATQAMLRYCAEVHAAKLANPTDDLASKLAHAEVDGQRLEPARTACSSCC
jgi:cytochrome P450